jgi:uncharacterized protein (UPF0332 family)
MEQGCSNSAANRTYYAAFQAARAAILAARASIPGDKWSHESVQARFSEIIYRRKLYPSRLRSHLSELRTTRDFADYAEDMVSLRMAKDALRLAEEFVIAIEKRIAP